MRSRIVLSRRTLRQSDTELPCKRFKHRCTAAQAKGEDEGPNYMST